MKGISKMRKKYGIGLDIGTSSIGWSVVDETGHIIRVKGQTGLGVRLFREGKTAADRRSFRTTRRRLSRRRWRLRLLREFFDQPISQLDVNFFARRKASSISPRDERFKDTYHLFNDQTDQEFYTKYPTIYHLRKALMTEHRQFDIREIYMAIHHIVKYRGHFLIKGDAKDFKPGQLNLETYFETLNAQWAGLFLDTPRELPAIDWSATVAMLTDNQQSRSDRQKMLTKQLISAGDKDLKPFYTEFSKAILGLKAKFANLVALDVDSTEQKTLTFSLETREDHQADLDALLTDDQMQMIDLLEKLHAGIQLAIIIPSGQTFSGQMVQRYREHHEHLLLLKAYKDQLQDENQKQALQGAYDAYIDQAMPQDDFYKAVLKVLKEDKALGELGGQIKHLIDQEIFMPKQRSKVNSSIPHQVQQQELDQIIETQKAYYPWLAAENPVIQHRDRAPYKLDELVDFRVPYYVGPLVQPQANKETSETKFAWMTRKNPNDTTAITPWNFDEKVDRQASANAFIQRMKTTDTYLIGEDVLPKNSLLYQRYEVLNELSNVRVNGELLSSEQKRRIYQDLFVNRTKATVTISDLQGNLVATGEVPESPEIKGLADPKRFLSSLTTYHDYNKVIPAAIKDPSKQADIEKIINWSTVFEDNQIFREKLMEIKWLTATQRRQLSQKRYRGWGQFSEKLLTGMRDSQGKTIMDNLWEQPQNFMQIIRRPEFQVEITKINQADLQDQGVAATIDGLYTSPQNKKAIRQVLLVVADIQRAMHGVAPSWLFIEAARGADKNPQRTKTRQDKLVAAYRESARDIVDQSVTEKLDNAIADKRDFEDRLVLYFQQNGHDIYAPKEELDFEQLQTYHIDHIIPQSMVKDDSLDNRVLTSETHNEIKGNRVAMPVFGQYQGYWRKLQRAGLISQRKLRHLLMQPQELDSRPNGFIARQLVETRQVIKLITEILSQQYNPETTKLVSIKAGLSHDFRQELNLPKLRDLNDYHHAHDAYLAARIGTYLLQRYPKLEPFFVYGQFKKTSFNLKRHFNFIGEMVHGKPDKQIIIKSPETGEVIWNQQDEKERVERLMSLKHLLVTHEVYDEHGPLFNQTIYSAKNPKNKKLIPRKQNQPIKIYGGFSGEETAYLAIVKVTGKKAPFYQVMRVPRRLADQLGRESMQQRKALLRDWFTPSFTNAKGKLTTFDVVVPHVREDQTVIDEIHGQRHRFSLGTNTYYHNQQQLVMSLDLQRMLTTKSENDEGLMTVYQQICQQVITYFPLYQLNKFQQKLVDAQDMLRQLPINNQKLEDGKVKLGKRVMITRILQGLHANPGVTKLNSLGISTDFGKLQVPGGIKLTNDAELVYESPTGLFQRYVRLNDL